MAKEMSTFMKEDTLEDGDKIYKQLLIKIENPTTFLDSDDYYNKI